MTDERLEILDHLRQEMAAAWAYLQAYAELFEHPDPRRLQLLEATAPGFFALVQGAFIESVLIRLARLLDQSRSGNKQNLSFERLFYPCPNAPDLTETKTQFGEISKDWRGMASKYAPLKEHRDKIHSHNDLSVIKKKNTQPVVSCKLTTANIQLLRDLFCRLWQVLKSAHSVLKGTGLVEPRHETLEQLPTTIFRYLIMGHNAMANPPELLGSLPEPEFDGVGNDGVLRIIV